jgi:hypothetical protein
VAIAVPFDSEIETETEILFIPHRKNCSRLRMVADDGRPFPFPWRRR